MKTAALQNITITFRNENDLSVLVNTDTFPTGKLYVNGAHDASVTVLINNIGTGRYSANWTMGNYADGSAWELEITATVDGIVYSRIIRDGYIDTDEATSLTIGRMTRLYALVGEINTISFYATGYDCDDRNIDFVIGSRAANDRSPRVFGVSDTVISNSSIIRDNTLITLTFPTTITNSFGLWPWYLVDRATNRQLVTGWLDVIYAA